MEYKKLKQHQRENRELFSDNLGIRVHRAISWFGRAEKESDDVDAQFIFLWISFNSAYANEAYYLRSITEQDGFRLFISRICELDSNKLIEKLIWQKYASSIRVLLENEYVFNAFWEFQRGEKSEAEWKAEFERAKSFAHKALGQHRSTDVLNVIFSRLYTLRNQMLHGGATWNSSVNREQLRDATAFLQDFIPIVIQVLMENHEQIWGDPCYPVVKL